MSKPKIEWRVQENGYYCLSGALERDTVPAFWQRRQEWMPRDGSVTIDLKAVSRVDSAGMVMLLHVNQVLSQKGTELKLLNVPEQLMTLLRLSHVESMFAACLA
ncbi:MULTISPECIES: lipid asymmetry maintenance protein MlaB [Photobacterium]|uniref:Anti-sigma B factor antagonist n=1 Tax=Photobacterium ganghwense TaxID=320778 RepID=A0A0J1H3L9_9GAMM|nr:MULTISPECIES: STAS domain-containing protein [Photobacterium]KLV06376.1 anti-sigma B factor antagonist [Photobacterium ganghwense]MBV1840213.1 STAS domain-containing protein [Photobacterium ganghwense]PSU06739.1 STAS domain-containing protein [Photobacterium ganghwense]QSV14415.1 STAS domain-containing protein [Photobacterium ganghwense]